MPTDQLLLFITLTCVVSASPGPVMLACMAYGGRYGLGRAGYGMAGATLGNLLLMLLSALGLGLLLAQSPSVFEALRWLGAAYLLWLGVELWRRTETDTRRADIDDETGTQLLLKSFGIAVSNPKGLIYFGALFPQFVAPEQPLFAQFALLTLIFVFMDLVWMLVYAQGGKWIMGWLHQTNHQRWFNRASGAALIAAALALAFTGH